jgi:hypothetical protein
MPTTTNNFDITELADIAVGALAQKLDFLPAFNTGIETDRNKGDFAKVFVHSKNPETGRDWDETSNNYGTDGGGYTIEGVNVELSEHIYDNAVFSQDELNRIDLGKVATGLAHNVARRFQIRLYNNLFIDSVFATNVSVGAADSFTHDNLADLCVLADDTGLLEDNRFAIMYNTYFANMKKDGVLVANRNQNSDPQTVESRFELINGFDVVSSSIMKSASSLSGEDTIGVITDGTGVGIAMGSVQFTGDGTGVAEYATAIDPKTGIPISIRKVYDQFTGKWAINAEILMGYKALDTSSTILLKSTEPTP